MHKHLVITPFNLDMQWCGQVELTIHVIYLISLYRTRQHLRLKESHDIGKQAVCESQKRQGWCSLLRLLSKKIVLVRPERAQLQ